MASSYSSKGSGSFLGDCGPDDHCHCPSKEDVKRKKINQPEGFVLKKALVFFRHGARTPLTITPKIDQAIYDQTLLDEANVEYHFEIIDALTNGPRPYSKPEAIYSALILKGGSESGQLTGLGKRQTTELGEALKKDYIEQHKLIDPNFIPDQIFLKSTNINRTIKSLCFVLTGLFGLEVLNRVSPVKIPVTDDVNEILIPNTELCPNLKFFHMKADHSPEMKNDRVVVEKSIGLNPGKDRFNWVEIRDDIIAREAHGLPIPKELLPHKDMIDRNATKHLYHCLCGLNERDHKVVTVLSCGLIVQALIDDLKTGTHRLYLYSCHDSTLIALLGALDIFDYKWPPFAADLRIELYENKDKKQFVKASYMSRNRITRSCTAIYSPIETFLKGMTPFAATKEAHSSACSCSRVEKLAKGKI